MMRRIGLADYPRYFPQFGRSVWNTMRPTLHPQWRPPEDIDDPTNPYVGGTIFEPKAKKKHCECKSGKFQPGGCGCSSGKWNRAAELPQHVRNSSRRQVNIARPSSVELMGGNNPNADSTDCCVCDTTNTTVSAYASTAVQHTRTNTSFDASATLLGSSSPEQCMAAPGCRWDFLACPTPRQLSKCCCLKSMALEAGKTLPSLKGGVTRRLTLTVDYEMVEGLPGKCTHDWYEFDGGTLGEDPTLYDPGTWKRDEWNDSVVDNSWGRDQAERLALEQRHRDKAAIPLSDFIRSGKKGEAVFYIAAKSGCKTDTGPNAGKCFKCCAMVHTKMTGQDIELRVKGPFCDAICDAELPITIFEGAVRSPWSIFELWGGFYLTTAVGRPPRATYHKTPREGQLIEHEWQVFRGPRASGLMGPLARGST